MVEMMVTICIFGILVAVAVPNFEQYLSNRRINNTAQAITSGLRTAQTHAVRTNLPTRLKLQTDSWQVIQSETLPGGNVTDKTVESYSWGSDTHNWSSGSNGILLTVTPAGADVVQFNGAGRVVAASQTLEKVAVHIPGNSKARPRWIQIDFDGFRTCNPDLPNDDPAGCRS